MFDFEYGSGSGRSRDVPRGRIDPITDPDDALLVIGMAMTHPLEAETIVISLGDDGCGRDLVLVPGTHDPRSILAVIDMMGEDAERRTDVSGLIVASIRPGHGADVDDLGRWHEADSSCRDFSLELIEWFVIADTVECPREFCGVEHRWSP